MDQAHFSKLPSVDLGLVEKLRDPGYRESFFLAETSAGIARQLIRLRRRRKLSQAELAKIADTKQSAVSRAEQATYQNWSFTNLWKLTNALGGRLRVIIEAWEDVLDDYRFEPKTLVDSAHYIPSAVNKQPENLRLGSPPTLGQLDVLPSNLNRIVPENQGTPSLTRNPSACLGIANETYFYRSEQGHLFN